VGVAQHIAEEGPSASASHTAGNNVAPGGKPVHQRFRESSSRLERFHVLCATSRDLTERAGVFAFCSRAPTASAGAGAGSVAGVTAGAHPSRPSGAGDSIIAAMRAATGTVAKPTRASLAPYGSHSSPAWTSPPQE
jgi:hypothetical protein